MKHLLFKTMFTFMAMQVSKTTLAFNPNFVFGALQLVKWKVVFIGNELDILIMMLVCVFAQ